MRKLLKKWRKESTEETTNIRKKNVAKSTSCDRTYKLNMPQMYWGGMSENWLLKELGDMHWSMLTQGLGVMSDELVDSNGQRLYASFVRLRWQSNASLYDFKENQSIQLNTVLSRYGSKMFFSDGTIECQEKNIEVNLMSVFSSRTAGDNKTLKKGTPLVPENNNISVHPKLPSFAKEYLNNKSILFSDDGQKEDLLVSLNGFSFPMYMENPIFKHDYFIEPYDDVNGVGLLYFASYPKISDKCERQYFNQLYKGNQGFNDWGEHSVCVARDIFYFGNANPDDELTYSLDFCKNVGKDSIQLASSLYRKGDGQLIAKIFTIKSVSFEVAPVVKSSKKLDQTIIKNTNTSTKIDQITLNNTIVSFLTSMMDDPTINLDSNLNLLGIESIVYMELSEHLNNLYQLNSNPSRFYGLEKISEISVYLLKEDISKTVEVKKESIKPKIPTATFNQKFQLTDFAIIATAFRLPKAEKEEDFWKILANGQSTIQATPGSRWKWPDWVDTNEEHRGVNQGGYLNQLDQFDAAFFRISASEAELMDPQQRILMELAWELIEKAGYKASALAGSKTGVFIGASGSDYELLLREKGGINSLTGTGTSMAVLANRLSYYFNFDAPSLQIDTACSSSLVAIHEAIKSIRMGESVQAIVGGINLMCHPSKSLAYYQSQMLSVDGKCQTFDDNANGYVRGEGAILYLIKPLEKAIEDRDRISAVIKGTAVNHGGQSGGLTVPNPVKQKSLLIQAYENASVDIDTIGYIEAHGTGTSLGDPIEVNSLTAAFSHLQNNQKTTNPWCGLGTVKSNIGHLEAAAGAAGVLKVILSMDKQTLPPTINFNQLNSKIELSNSPFYIQNKKAKWETKGACKNLRAGVSSFGIGGANAHVVLESFQHQSFPYHPNSNYFIFPISAKTANQLSAYVLKLKNYLIAKNQIQLASLAYTFQFGREEMDKRIVFVATNKEELLAEIAIFLSGNTKPLNLADGNLSKLVNSWANGEKVNWDSLYSDNYPDMIDAPTYPFAPTSYWITANEIKETATKGFDQKQLISSIVDMVAKVTYVAKDDIDIEEFFMDYGIDSLSIVQLVKQINQQYQLKLKAIDIHDCLTVGELATFLMPLIQKNPSVQPIQKNINTNQNALENEFAIIGLNLQIPGANSLEDFWNVLEAGDFYSETYPDDRWERLPAALKTGHQQEDCQGSFLEDIIGFDNRFFKINNREAMLMDPQQRLLLQSVWQAIENAGYKKQAFAEKNTSVFLSINAIDYADIVKYDDKVDEYSGNGISPYIAANRISHFFDLKGISEPVDTACSSFFVAVKRAMDAMQKGISEQAIVAGVQLNMLPFEFKQLAEQGLISSSGRTMAFDQRADGFVRAEGLGTIILKPLQKAIADKDHIYSVIKGVGIWHGGRSVGLTTPNVEAHQEAMMQAINESKLDINNLAYVEAHGTGMSIGDISEQRAFSKVLNNLNRSTINPPVLSASKSTLGHLESASGAAVVMKGILSLQKGMVPGISALGKIHEDISAEDFIMKDGLSPLKVDDGTPFIGLNSYGLGGVSAFMVMEGWEAEKEEEILFNDPELFVLSAESKKVLHKYVEKLANFLEKDLEKSVSDFNFRQLIAAYQLGRNSMKYRLGIIANNKASLLNKLKMILVGQEDAPDIYTVEHSSNEQFSLEEMNQFLQNKNWDKVGRAWVSGAKIPWEAKPEQRYPFPEYPFDTDRKFWIVQKKKEKNSSLEIENKIIETNRYLMLEDN